MKRREPLLALLLLGALTVGSSQAAEFFLRADVTTITVNGEQIQMWGFAQCTDNTFSDGTATVPGPALEVPFGDAQVTIHLKNNLTETSTTHPGGYPVSLFIPGQAAIMNATRFPADDPNYANRIRSAAEETAPGGVGTYQWNNFRPGTFLYHSGTQMQVQVQMGLYGAIKKDAAADTAYPGVTYDKEIVLLYSEIDPEIHEAVATNNYGPGTSMTSTINYTARYFLINGQPFSGDPANPGAAPVGDTDIQVGDEVLIRFLSASQETHVPSLTNVFMDVVAEDGNPYPHVRKQYSVLLSPGKTQDAIATFTSARSYPVMDRRFFLTSRSTPARGMLTYIPVTAP